MLIILLYVYVGEVDLYAVLPLSTILLYMRHGIVRGRLCLYCNFLYYQHYRKTS